MTENITEAPTREQPSTTRPHWQWFALRDLTRTNAKNSGYLKLAEEGFEVFTPMRWMIYLHGSKRVKQRVPVIHDLLFVHCDKKDLDPIINRTMTLQYRYQRGGGYCEPMVVRDEDMDMFIRAVQSTDEPRYYTPDEITPEMIGKKVRINGGLFGGFEGNLLSIRGSGKKRLIVSIPGLIIAAPEISPEFIEIID